MPVDTAVGGVLRAVVILAVGAIHAFSQVAPPAQPPPPRGIAEPAQQSPLGTPQLRPDQLGSIAGKVVDGESGAPLTTGWVMASRPSLTREVFGARIQPDGTYKIHRLEPGSYALRFTSPGYTPAQYQPGSDGSPPQSLAGTMATPVTVSAGSATDRIDFRAYRQGVILGRVLDENGQPMPQAQVRASSPMEINGSVQMVPRGHAMTDDRGEYRMGNLAPGDYEIAVEARMVMRMGNMIDRTDPLKDQPLPSYESTYYPGVTDRAHATPVRVASGEEKFGIDFLLRPSGGYAVSGTVFLTDGRPCTQCLLAIMKKSDDNVSFLMPTVTSTNPRDGSFVRTGLSDGIYQITGGSRSPNEGGYLAGEIAVAGVDVKELRFTLRPGVTITGSLRMDGTPKTAPAESPRQTYVFLQPKDSQRLMSFGGGRVASSPRRDGVVDDEGQFRFEETQPMRYHVRATLQSGYYLSQVIHGAEDVSASGLDLTDASGEVRLRLIAKADGGLVHGKVIGDDGDPKPGAQVRMIPLGAHQEREDYSRSVVSDQSGAFRLDTVVPGDYVLFALASQGTPIVSRSAEMEQLKQRGQRITVKPDSTQQVEVRVVKLETPR